MPDTCRGQRSTVRAAEPRRWFRALAVPALLAVIAGLFAPTVTADDGINETISADAVPDMAVDPPGPPAPPPPTPTISTVEAQYTRRAAEDNLWDKTRTGRPTPMDLVNHAIGATAMHQAGIDGAGVGIALLDTGVVPVDGLLTPGKVIEGPDLSFESQIPGLLHLDTYGHGTHLAGIMAGNGTNFRGVAPGSHILSLKLASHDGATDVTQVIAAIDWVVQHGKELGIRVINLAYGTDSTQDYRIDPLSFAVENAWKKGFVVVTSGGNAGRWAPLNNPATNPYVIAVGASDDRDTPGLGDDVVPAFSSTGTMLRTVDVVAPGQSVISLRNPGSYADTLYPNARVESRFFRGTGSSQSAAVVSGAVALLLQQRPELTPDQVKALLMGSAQNIRQVGSGSGVVNVQRASKARVAGDVTQTWPASTGLGSLEASRGTSHVADGGVELIGELDIFGQPWDGRRWTEMAWSGRTWTGGEWMGRRWTGDTWSADGWTGRRWTGATWTGDAWSGRRWTSDGWAGRRWTSEGWTGEAWHGRRWTGQSWTGRPWASRTWR